MEETGRSAQALAEIMDEIFSDVKPVKKDDSLSKVLEAMGDSLVNDQKYTRTNYSYLQDHCKTMREDLEEILETYFPDRWEIKVVREGNVKSLEEYVNKATFKDISNRDKFMEEFIRMGFYNSFHSVKDYLVTIHFPLIEIKNSKKQSHIIRDLWMKLPFNFIFRCNGMYGTRSTKTYAEYSSNYNHSHMPTSSTCSADTRLGCCLGSTHYRDTATEVSHKFDKNVLALYLQQLTDYLSWESLEGGPHIRMESIGNRNYNNGYNSGIRQNHYEDTYKEFLRKYPKGYNIELTDNGSFFNFKVVKDEDFKAKVTECCPEEIKVLYDTVLKQQYISANTATSQGIEQMNTGFKREKMFDFKGQPIYFQIFDPNKGQVQEIPNVIKIAPDTIIENVKNKLEQSLNKFYIDRFVAGALRK